MKLQPGDFLTEIANEFEAALAVERAGRDQVRGHQHNHDCLSMELDCVFHVAPFTCGWRSRSTDWVPVEGKAMRIMDSNSFQCPQPSVNLHLNGSLSPKNLTVPSQPSGQFVIDIPHFRSPQQFPCCKCKTEQYRCTCQRGSNKHPSRRA